MTLSTPPGILRQLYVMAPICTPPKFESGAAPASASAIREPLPNEPVGIIEKAAIAAVLPRNFLLESPTFDLFLFSI
jgi:hypothetical protein